MKRRFGAAGQAHRPQRAVEAAALDEEQHPAVEADVLRHEEWKDEEQADETRPAAKDAGEVVGDGIGDDGENGDGEPGEDERADEGHPDGVGRVEISA